MHILVTGGAGFIGSHTCVVLLDAGHKVTIIDSFVNSSKKTIDGIKIIFKEKRIDFKDKLKIYQGDLRNKKTIEEVFNSSVKENDPINAVIHFASLKSVIESFEKPILYWTNNVIGSLNLVDVMSRFNCKNLVFSSSANIYDFSDDKPINENHKIKPTSPYGNNKATIEKLFNDIFNGDPESWRISNLRYFNPIGAHHSGEIGESPISIATNIFPLITKVALGKKKEFIIFGGDWPTKDGTGVRDYIHVMDIAEGHLKALNYLIDNNPLFINLNLGTGKGTSVLELITTFEKVNNVKIPLRFATRRKGDKAFVVADNKLANKLMKWNPKKSLEEMCIDGWKWVIK